MDIDEDDDFYAPDDNVPESAEQTAAEPVAEPAPQPDVKAEQPDEDVEEEGEDEDEAGSGSDSDIDIITERKDGSKPAPPSQPRYNEIRNIPQRASTSTNEVATKPPTIKKETSTKPIDTPTISGADLPGLAISKIDVDAKPMYEPAGKPITQINIDEDLNENDKPWRRPGTDISDYFNYGFDEFTWALYANKQETLRSEFDPNKVAQSNKKMFEELNMMMGMGGGVGGMPGGGMPGMEGMTPEMMQHMQQMISSGVDPSQMDPSMFGGGANSAGGAGGGFPQGGFGFDQNSMMSGGGGGGGGEGRNRGGNFGRGRGGRRNW